MSDAGNGGSGSASSSSATAVLKKPVLKPPRFGSSASSASSAFTMSAAKLQFPGFKESKLGDSVAKLGAAPATVATVATGAAATSSTPAATDSPSTTTLGFIPLTKNKPSETAAAASTTAKSDTSNADLKPTDNGGGAVNATTASASSTVAAPSTSSSSTFVFGQRCDDRVENVQKTSSEEATKQEEKSPEVTAEVGKATSNEQEVPEEKKSASAAAASGGKTLSEAAAEYCESHQAQKRRYEEITPVTGEENERNVAQISAKLYVFDKAGSTWMEKGRGCLRLNDDEAGHSRIVMRTAGSLRVILNTKLFAGMSIESPSEKNIRMTGMDGEGQARIFLIGGSAKDIGRLFALVKERTAAAAAPPATAASSSEDASENGEYTKRPKVQEDDA